MLNKFVLINLLLVFPCVWSANILMVGMTLSRSHHHWIESLSLELVENGHNVTFLSVDGTKVKRDNYTVIHLDGLYEKYDFAYTSDAFKTTLSPLTISPFVDLFYDFLIDLCDNELHHPVLRKRLLSYPKDFKFDLIMWDHTMGECLYPLIEFFGSPPVIGLSPYGLTDPLEAIFGHNIYNYVGNIYMTFTRATTLWQRILNTWMINYSAYSRRTHYKPRTVEVSRTVFSDWDEQKFERTENSVDVVLVNYNNVLNEAQPLSPNIVPVGGIQIARNIQPTLPKNLEDIYANASKGVIYFSLGSNVKSEAIPMTILQSFGQCFSGLGEYQVIWKIAPPAGLKLPPNVTPVTWAPQTNILAHKKTKLFITHGGGLSTHETTYFGVPVVVVPVFLDQANNGDKLRVRGGGEMVLLSDMLKTEEGKHSFCENVKKVLFTESYSKTMKQMSMKYRDLEVHPRDTMLHWVNYMLKYGHAKHLSPVSRNMSAFYTQNLDIYLMIAACVVVTLCTILGLFKCIFRRWLRSGKTDKKKND